MTWTSLYLRAADEAEMLAALSTAGLVHDIDGESFVGGDNRTHVAVLGVLSRGTGVMLDDGEGGEYEQQEVIPGYHVNVRTLDADVITALAPVTIAPEPETPAALWQGQVTID